MKSEIIVESVSNGLGSQSMYVFLMAARGEIPARVSITADTGSESDCLWSDGRRTSAEIYFKDVVFPYAAKHSIDARFVRAIDKYKQPLPNLIEHTKSAIASGKMNSIKIPLFGSRGGRLRQNCTDRWKVAAIKQEARRMGATKLITAQGIHFAEAGRRVKGFKIGKHDRWTLYQDTEIKNKIQIPIKWCTHYYPLVDLEVGRKTAVEELNKEKIPFLVTSQCDDCPHNDLDRWLRHTPEKLVEISEIEASMKGEFFFTDERIPLLEALAVKASKPRKTVEETFGCKNSYCGV